MTGIGSVNTQQLDTAGLRPQGGPGEPHLPAGKSLRSVQPHPLPLISQAEGPRPVLDEQAVRQQVAQARIEITGTGGIVDNIA